MAYCDFGNLPLNYKIVETDNHFHWVKMETSPNAFFSWKYEGGIYWNAIDAISDAWRHFQS